MKSRIVSLIVGIVGVFCLVVPSVGKLYIEDLLGYENSESVSKGEDGKFAVTFSSDFGNEVKYFPAGYRLLSCRYCSGEKSVAVTSMVHIWSVLSFFESDPKLTQKI